MNQFQISRRGTAAPCPNRAETAAVGENDLEPFDIHQFTLARTLASS